MDLRKFQVKKSSWRLTDLPGVPYTLNMAITTKQVKELLVETFELDQSPDEIADNTAIIGSGLHLTSVDVLEIVSQVDKRFKIKIKNQDIKKDSFASVAQLTQFLNGYKA
jgi:acyl carrier protein